VKLTARSTLTTVALAVGGVLRRHGITAVLTGGACASLHTDGSYVSKDADFVVQGLVRQAALDFALAELGFERQGDRYVHPRVRFYLEFPPGPLAIGSDLDIDPIEVDGGNGPALVLSPTDSCRDRLAAFYHWRDWQSLRLAISIAQTHQVDLKTIEKWSRSEGSLDAYQEFLRELARPRPTRARRQARQP
jgi:hypothetical protein